MGPNQKERQDFIFKTKVDCLHRQVRKKFSNWTPAQKKPFHFSISIPNFQIPNFQILNQIKNFQITIQLYFQLKFNWIQILSKGLSLLQSGVFFILWVFSGVKIFISNTFLKESFFLDVIQPQPIAYTFYKEIGSQISLKIGKVCFLHV